MRSRFLFLLPILCCAACSSTYEAHNAQLRQACNGGDKASCSAYTAAVADCESHLSLLAHTESWSTKNCEGQND
jgi:hypothetical protein